MTKPNQTYLFHDVKLRRYTPIHVRIFVRARYKMENKSFWGAFALLSAEAAALAACIWVILQL